MLNQPKYIVLYICSMASIMDQVRLSMTCKSLGFLRSRPDVLDMCKIMRANTNISTRIQRFAGITIMFGFTNTHMYFSEFHNYHNYREVTQLTSRIRPYIDSFSVLLYFDLRDDLTSSLEYDHAAYDTLISNLLRYESDTVMLKKALQSYKTRFRRSHVFPMDAFYTENIYQHECRLLKFIMQSCHESGQVIPGLNMGEIYKNNKSLFIDIVKTQSTVVRDADFTYTYNGDTEVLKTLIMHLGSWEHLDCSSIFMHILSKGSMELIQLVMTIPELNNEN